MKAILPLIFSLCVFSCCLNAQNNSLDFDGNDDQVAIPNSAALDLGTSAVTVECWVYLRELPADISGDFASIYDSAEDSYILYLDKSNDELRFKVTDAELDAERPGIPSTSLPLNTWIHIAGVYDGSENAAKIYLNGSLIDTHPNAALGGQVRTGQSPFMGNQNGSDRPFNGKIDEFRVWNRALCPEEIIFRKDCELTGTESGLVSYYSFNQGTANAVNTGETSLNDVAGGSNGTLTGFQLNGSTSNWVSGATGSGTCGAYAAPVIQVSGNGNVIANGDNTPEAVDYTNFFSLTNRTYYITNTGGGFLQLNSYTISGTHADDFQVTSQPTGDLGASLVAAIPIALTPTGMGVRTATVNINYSLCGVDYTYSFAVQATVEIRRWDNGAGTVNWEDSENWLPDGTPGAGDIIYIESGAQVTVTSGTYSVEKIDLRSGGAQLNIGSAATINISGSNDGIEVRPTTSLNNSGTLVIDNCTARGIRIDGNLTNLSTGSITITGTNKPIRGFSGGAMTNEGMISIEGSGTFPGQGNGIRVDGPFTNESTGIITINNAEISGIRAEGSDTFINKGQITINNPKQNGIETETSFSNQASGEINIHNAGNKGFYNFGSAATSNAGTLNIIDSAAEAIDDATFSSTGVLSGEGTFKISGVTSGTVRPGNSPGLMTFTNNIPMNAALEFEAEGTTPDTEHDQIVINGAVDLTGASINFSLINGYLPPLSGSTDFTILTSSTLIGLPTFNLPSGTGHDWSAAINGSEIIVTAAGLLPVEFTFFRAQPVPEGSLLEWETSFEENNEGFEVQHSTNGRDWQTVSFIQGKGFSDVATVYSFVHENPQKGVNYYRLLQKDFDGTSTYSEVLSVNIEYAVINEIAVYPNPCSSDLFLKDYIGTFEITDEQGRQFLKGEITNEGTAVRVADLPKGLYFLKLTGQDRIPLVKRFAKH